MKKLLLAFVLMTGTAGAQTYDSIGRCTGRVAVWDPTPAGTGNWATVAGETYTAETGDTVTNFFISDSGCTAVAIGIYTWVSGAPDDMVFADTITCDGNNNSTDSMTTKFGLTNGTTYSIEACIITSTGGAVRWGLNASTANGIKWKTASCLADPYPAGTFDATGSLALAARVTKYGAGAPATTQISIGPSSWGPSSVGP